MPRVGVKPPVHMLVDEGFLGGSIAPAVGLSAETTRLAALALLVLLVYSNGRAIARAVGIIFLSFVITLWAVLRRLWRALFGRPPTQSTTPKSTAAAAELATISPPPPLPPVKVSMLIESAREVVRLHEACDVLAAARLLDAIDAGTPAASHATKMAVSAELGGGVADAVRARREATLEALRLFVDDGGWTGTLEMLGATTRFRREDGGGTMTVRVDGVIDGVPLADVLAVWREGASASLSTVSTVSILRQS